MRGVGNFSYTVSFSAIRISLWFMGYELGLQLIKLHVCQLLEVHGYCNTDHKNDLRRR